MSTQSNKRTRLMEAAKVLIHRKGFYLTTLADIATESGVPLGNVYYYFKTKEAIGEMVIQHLINEFRARSALLESRTDVVSRLLGLMEYSPEELESLAQYGCPIGGLCQELGKFGGNLANLSASLINSMIEWAGQQFECMGYTPARATDLGVQLVARCQGSILLTHTFKDPTQMERMRKATEKWLRTVALEKTAA